MQRIYPFDQFHGSDKEKPAFITLGSPSILLCHFTSYSNVGQFILLVSENDRYHVHNHNLYAYRVPYYKIKEKKKVNKKLRCRKKMIQGG